jgi:hypothetical protein
MLTGYILSHKSARGLVAMKLGGSRLLVKRDPRQLAILLPGVFVVAWAALASAAPTPVKLNAWTTPDNGVSGVNNVNITGSAFPSETITPGHVSISLATACKGKPAATTTATSIKTIIGTSSRVNFAVPGSLSKGTYFVSISDSADSVPITSNNCSQLSVTKTNPILSACVPSSSLGVLAPVKGPANVAAYVPNGCWGCGSSSNSGILFVPLEPTPLASPTAITTAGVVNSCAANSTTGEVVCVANDTDVYTISGTTITNTLTSGSDGSVGFSGGSCHNCGVAIDGLHNKAAIAVGLSAPSSRSGVQYLDLGTNAFAAPVPTINTVSEDISIDPTRQLLLSASERGSYDLLQTPSSGFVAYQNFISNGGVMDSSAEDCSTGIALASSEGSENVVMADLTQAHFTLNSPNFWTAGSDNAAANVVNLPGTVFSAGTCGISVAQGSSHLAVVTGEFGGNSFAILQLPSTSGSGKPNLVDWAYVSSSVFPTEPDGGIFSAGFDPHTVTTYVSPNSGKATAVMASSPFPAVNCLAVIDMASVLGAPRAEDGHTVASLPSGAISFVWTGQGQNCTQASP